MEQLKGTRPHNQTDQGQKRATKREKDNLLILALAGRFDVIVHGL